MNVFDTLSRAGRQWPDRPAIIDTAGSLDYRSLWRDIDGLRIQLARLGVREGQGVGIRARNGRAFVIGALAALGCGAVVMPIPQQMRPDEMSDMLIRAPLSFILDDGCARDRIGEATSGVEVPGGSGLRLICMASPGVPRIASIGDAAFVRFTSGTTGAAKGVVLTHQGVLERMHAANTGLGLTCQDRVLWVLPMAYHFYVSILLYLEVGAAIIINSDYLATSILDAAARHEASFLYVTPMHVRLLVCESARRTLPPSLKRVMSVSSRLDPQVARDFLARYHVPVAQGYGIIEVGLPIMNIEEAAEHPGGDRPPLARVLTPPSWTKRWIRRLPNETGQLALRGPGMFAGYLSPARPCAEVLHGAGFSLATWRTVTVRDESCWMGGPPRSSTWPATKSSPRRSPRCWISTRRCCVRG